MGAWLYILQCADGSYCTGTTRGELEKRVAEHQSGHFPGFTSRRRPVVLVYSEYFDRIVDVIAAEQIKGWSRAKKEALMAGDFDGLDDCQSDAPFSDLMVRDAPLRDAPHHEV